MLKFIVYDAAGYDVVGEFSMYFFPICLKNWYSFSYPVKDFHEIL